MTAVLIVLGLIAIVVGILGTIYPALPGLGLMFGGAWLLGYAGDYQVFGSGTLTFLAIVAVFGTAMDYVAGALGAKYTGASKPRFGVHLSAALLAHSSLFPACCSAR